MNEEKLSKVLTERDAYKAERDEWKGRAERLMQLLTAIVQGFKHFPLEDHCTCEDGDCTLHYVVEPVSEAEMWLKHNAVAEVEG